jgi:hypothetical protein
MLMDWEGTGRKGAMMVGFATVFVAAVIAPLVPTHFPTPNPKLQTPNFQLKTQKTAGNDRWIRHRLSLRCCLYLAHCVSQPQFTDLGLR